MQGEYCASAHILRGLAALAVAWFHFTNGQPLFLDQASFLALSGRYGYLGVPIFFVISGFVIPYSLYRMNYRFPHSIPEFVRRRFWRIYPAYLASIILTLLAVFASSLLPFSSATLPAIDIRTVIGHLSYTAPWIGTDWLIPIFWSLAIEIQFYVVMIFLAPLLLSKKRRTIFLTMVSLNCLCFLSNDRTLLFWYLPTFCIGISWYLLFSKRLSAVDASAQAAAFAITGFITMSPDYAISAAITFPLLAIPIKAPWRSLVFLGTISYSFYLLHSLVGGRIVNLATRLPHEIHLQVAVLISALLASVGFSYLFWRFVEEMPARIWRSRTDRAPVGVTRGPDGATSAEAIGQTE